MELLKTPTLMGESDLALQALDLGIIQFSNSPVIDLLTQWIERHWLPIQDSPQAYHKLATPAALAYRTVLAKLLPNNRLKGDYSFVGFDPLPNFTLPSHVKINDEGEALFHTGPYLYHFQGPLAGELVSVLVVIGIGNEYCYQPLAVAAAVQADFMPVWVDFVQQCEKLYGAQEPGQEVVIIGGRMHSFVPKVDWEDIILPAALKDELLGDVKAFFQKGVAVYRRLKLKPFRKLLLAGVPGTGKTMLCSALAKWAIGQEYLVIYISSADQDGATFAKIEQALEVASRSKVPTLILLEELDAYLKPEEKAMVLNVLDGSEAAVNEQGTLLIATTNYPEAIDERVLKRPGRLDRIFIIPETQHQVDAIQMLKQYLGEMWQEDHAALAEDLVGYPGAFIREVAIYALTQVAYEDLPELSLDLLQTAYHRLKDQIEARDDFLHRRGALGLLHTE
jgi:hypothetical protein